MRALARCCGYTVKQDSREFCTVRIYGLLDGIETSSSTTQKTKDIECNNIKFNDAMIGESKVVCVRGLLNTLCGRQTLGGPPPHDLTAVALVAAVMQVHTGAGTCTCWEEKKEKKKKMRRHACA